MERETKTISIGAHEVVLKTYLTAGEAKQIKQSYFEGSKVEIVGETPKLSDFNPNVQIIIEEATIKALVVSVDGATDKIIESVNNWKQDEYAKLVEAVEDIAGTDKKK